MKRATRSRLAAVRSWSTSTVGTRVTSVLAAKPKTSTCTTGATKMIGIILWSCLSCRNSLTITRHSTRMGSGLPPREARRAQHDHGEAVDEERHGPWPVGEEGLGLQDDAGQDDGEVAVRDEVGDGLEPGRHHADLEDETGQQDRGEHRRDEPRLERERLRVRERRDEEAEGERAE